MNLIFSMMESTEMPEFLRRGSMDDGDCEAAALRTESDDESLSAEASNKDVSLRKNAFEQKCGINVIVHADENNSDSDSASNFSPHSEVVNGVSEISKDGMSEEETKDTHFNMEPRNGMNKDEDSIDEFGDVGTEFSSQDFVPKTLGLKDEISESEDDGGGGGGDDDSSSYTALKNTVSDGTADNGFNEPSTNPKTNVIQETAQANEHEIMEKKCSGEASKSEFYNDDGGCAVAAADDDDENNDWQGRSTPENTSKPSIVEDYLSDENSSDKEVSKVLSDNETVEGKLADRQFKEISCETSSESETDKGDASAEAKFKEIEKGISSEEEEEVDEEEEEEEEEEAATLECKQSKEISEDHFSEDETAVRDSLGDEVSETEKFNASSEHNKDEISEDESIKSTTGEEIREDSTERKTVSYDDIHRSSAEECDKTDTSDCESDDDSSALYSPRADDSCNFDDHFKHSDDHISSSDSESVGKGSIGDSEEKSSYSHDFKHKKSECSLSPDGRKYKDVRQDKDETFSENSFDDNILNSSSEDVKAQNYLPQDRICEADDEENEINKDESERTELRDLQTSVAAENESSQLASTYNTIEEIKAHEGSTFQTNTEKAACSSSVENEGNENDVDIPLYNKDLKSEETEEESSEVAPKISQTPKTILETELQGESVLESEDDEEHVLNEERNLGTQSCENLSKENICDSSSIRKPENVSETCQDSCEEKLLQQEDKSVKIGDFSFLSKDNSSENEDLKREENRNSDSEESISIGKGSDENEYNLSCELNVSDDDRNTRSPCQILDDEEQRAMDMKSVNMSAISQDNQSNDGSSPQVKAESITNVTQKDDDGGPFSSGDESVTNNESDDGVRDLVSLDEICETETSVDINEGECARTTESGSVENNDNLFEPQKETKTDSIREHQKECETTQSLLVVESKESDAGSRETTTEDVDFEGTINDAQSELQMESLSIETSRTISPEDNSAVALSSEQHASSVTVEERASVEGNADMVSDGHQIPASTDVAVSELKDKADVGEICSAGSVGLLSSETDELEADNSKRSLLESDNPDNDSVDSTGHISSEKDKSEVDMLNRSLSGINDPENVPGLVPANINERSLDDIDPVKSTTPNHLENDDAFNDKKFSSDETKSMDSKKEEEKEEEEEEEEEEEDDEKEEDKEEEESEKEEEKEEEEEEGEKGKEEEKVEEEEGEKTEKEEEGGGKEEVEAAAAAKEEEKETHEETKIISSREECDSASNSLSQNSVQELVQNNSSPDTTKDNSSYVERLPCTEIPKDSALEASEFQVELNEKRSTNVNENITGKISQDTNSYSAAEEPGNVDIRLHCSKGEEMDHTEENNSLNIANGLETPAKYPATEHSTGAPVISDDVGILPENAETSTKIELPLSNGTDCQQTLENSAMETDDLKDRLTEESKSNQENTVNDIQSEKIVKKASIMENLTANDSGSSGDQVNNESRKRKLSSSPEDEPVSKEGCSLQYKGFKKRILAQASLEVADEQMHHQHQTLPKPEELQPDLADSYTTPLTEYAQYLGLQPIVKFKCYLCGETGFPSILSLQEHQSSCLKTSKTRPVSQQPAVPEAVPAESAEGDCPAVGVAAATAAGPADVSGTPSTNFRISRKVYLCSVCGTYYENWNLFLHMKEMHRRFICLFCLTMFTDAGMLATHLSGEHSVTDRLYDTQEGFRAEIADEACFLVCCDCETIFAHTDNFYEHVCPTAPSVEKHRPQQEPKLLQKHRHQQQKQKEIEQSNQHMQGVCSLCGLRGAHFPTCRRASSNSNALTTLVDGSGAVTELSPPDSEQQSEKQPVAKTDTVKKRTGKGKATTKTLPSGDIDAEVDGDEDYDISHAASFCQINIHETPADKPKASDHSASSTPVAKVTLKTKNIPTIVLSNNSATKKNIVSVVKQEPDTPGIHNEVDEKPTETHTDSAVLESQKPKKTAESIAVTGIRSGKRGASCSPVPTTEGKKAKFDQLKDPVTASVEDTEERRGQTSSPVPESDSSSSHSQDSDRLHINTQESESVDGQSCADEDDAAVKEAAKDPEATDADKTEEECTTSEKQVTPASTIGQHPRDRISESESESSGSANDIPSHKTEDSSSSSEAEVASSSEDRKRDPPPKDTAKQKSEDISDDGGGTAEGPESGGEESSKDSPALVVDEEAADDKKDNGSGSSQPTTAAEGGEIQVAGDDVPALELTLEEQPEVMTLQALVKECVRVSCNSCVFCNHAKKIAVNGSQLALHLLAEHRFEPVVCTDTADLKPVPADGFTARLKEAVHNLHEAFFNTDSYDSTAEPSEVSSAERGDSSHVYDRSYECFHCHFVTTLHKELYVHNRKMHQKTILLCVMCKSNFYSYSELLCHICPGLYAPDADISFRCCLCTVDKLPSAFRLMVHLRKRHHACDVCLEATGDQQRLSNHVWKHKLHHLCYRCGIAYRNKPDITKHLFWKHGTESVLCKKCLQKKWPHVYHFCIPPTAFNCEECGTSFARAVALKVHRRLHSGDRPYTCEDCPDSFISRKLLARHRRLKHAPPEPSPPPRPSSLEKNATAQREREYPGALETEARSVRDSDTDQDKSTSENKMSVSLDNRTDNQMSSDGEKQNDAAVKKNKVMDVYDLPPLNLSSDSDDSDEPDNKDSKTVTSPAAVSAPDVKDSETEEKPEPPVADSVAGEDEEPAPVQIIDGIWDNFKNYKASLERKEQEAAAASTGSHSTSQASLELKEQEEAAATTESHSTSQASRESEEQEAAAVTTGSDSTLPESLELKEQEAAAESIGLDSTLKESLECEEQEPTTEATESYSTSHAIEVIMSDHDYCMVSKPSNLGTVDGAESGEGASLHIAGGLSAEGLDVSDKTIEGDKDSGSNTDSSPETMEATDDGNRSKVVAADSVSAVSVNNGLRVSSGPEKTLTQLSDTGRAPVAATEASPSVPFGTPPQPSNLSTTTSSKKRTKQPRKRQKRDGASSSSSSSSSDSDSSSCSCGTNCSCSSSSSSSSGSSSSSSDSDSSTSEGRRRQAARRERRRERARKKAAAAATAAEAADAVPANASEAAAEPMSRTPTANSVPVAPSDTERECADDVIHESDLETDETETDEDFYDQHPQRQANRLLAEKRNRLMLLAAVAPASNGTAQLAQQLQELNQQQQQQHQEQQHHQRQEEPQQQQRHDDQQTQPVPLQQTLQQLQPQQRIRIGPGTASGDSRKVRTRKRKRAVLSDARTNSASLARSAETVVRPLGSLPLTTYRDSSGVVTQTSIPESTSVSSATSAVRTAGGSGSEGESKRLSKRRRVPKRFYGDSSDEDGEVPVTPQPKWRKTGGGGGSASGAAAGGASVASVGATATPSHVPEPPHLPIRQQVTLPSAAALLSSARSVAAGRRPVETMGHSSSSSSSSSSGSDDADSNYESASDGGGGGGNSGSRVGGSSSGGVGVGSVTGARTGGTAGAEVDNSGNKSENLYCYCQCPYDEVSEMIACDGKDCQIEWFHFECVGIMVPPKGKWFCPDCRKKSSASRGGEYLLHA